MITTPGTRLFIPLLILCFFNLVFLPDFLAASELEDAGYIKLKAKYEGLEVQLDGAIIGYTPLNLFKVTAGTHIINVAHFDKTNWLGGNWEKKVVVEAGDTLVLDVTFKKSLFINSTPYGADIYFENQNVGKTPFYLDIREDETPTVTLKKTDYQDTTFTVNNTDFEKVNIHLNNANTAVTLGVGKRQTYKKKLMWALGTSALSGALALYFRTKADDKYRRYKRTGNPEYFNSLYDDAITLDKYAAVSYATFQVSFVFSFYFFFAYQNR